MHGLLSDWQHGTSLDDAVYSVAATIPANGVQFDPEAFVTRLRADFGSPENESVGRDSIAESYLKEIACSLFGIVVAPDFLPPFEFFFADKRAPYRSALPLSAIAL